MRAGPHLSCFPLHWPPPPPRPSPASAVALSPFPLATLARDLGGTRGTRGTGERGSWIAGAELETGRRPRIGRGEKG